MGSFLNNTHSKPDGVSVNPDSLLKSLLIPCGYIREQISSAPKCNQCLFFEYLLYFQDNHHSRQTEGDAIGNNQRPILFKQTVDQPQAYTERKNTVHGE